MPGIDIGAIMSAIGSMLLNALVNAITNTLTQLITGAISSIADSIAESLSGLQGPLGFIGDAISTFAHNLAAELNEATATLLNAVNAWAHDTIPILKNQQDLSNLIVGEVAEQVDALKQYLGFQVEQQYRTGAAITSYLLEFVNRHGDSYEELGRKLFEIQQELVSGDVLTAEEAYNKGLNFVTEYLMYDLQAVERMTQEDLQAAAEFIANQLTEHFDWVRTWFQNTIVAPVTYANAFRSAFTNGIQMTPDEYADMLVAHQEAVDKATQKYMEKLEKELEKQGEI